MEKYAVISGTIEDINDMSPDLEHFLGYSPTESTRGVENFKSVKEALSLYEMVTSKSEVENVLPHLCTFSRSQRYQICRDYLKSFDQKVVDTYTKYSKRRHNVLLLRILTEELNTSYLYLLNDCLKSGKLNFVVFLLFLSPRQKYLSGEVRDLCMAYVKADDSSPEAIQEPNLVATSFTELTDKDLLHFYENKIRGGLKESLETIRDLREDVPTAMAHFVATSLNKDPDFIFAFILLISDCFLKDVMKKYNEIKGYSLLENCTKIFKGEDLATITVLLEAFPEI
ncbi:hypothetical protein HZS_825 [Henneguya salminicola]|nr:hypothetical protein HZS_825 [Henneguya salminicola]